MSHTRIAALVLLCVAATACSDAPVAPVPGAPTTSRGTLPEQASDRAGTPGPSDRANDAALSRLVSGRVDVAPAPAITQRYTFTVRPGDVAPAATGTFRGTIMQGTSVIEIDADLDCYVTFGTEAWASGPVTRYTVNGTPRAVTFHISFHVSDGDAGTEGAPDLGSALWGVLPQTCSHTRGYALLPGEQTNVVLR